MDRRQTYAIMVATVVLIGYWTWHSRSRSLQNVLVTAAVPSWAVPVSFQLDDLGTSPEGSMRLLATDKKSTNCSFEIMIESPAAAKGGPGAFASAELARSPLSDCKAFLGRLADSLGFKGDLPNKPGVNRLKVVVAILGKNLSMAAGDDVVAGGFTSKPAGNWMATKLFVAEGEGEVFLNLNPKEHMGAFSVKDEEYATTVVTELANVFLPAQQPAP